MKNSYSNIFNLNKKTLSKTVKNFTMDSFSKDILYEIDSVFAKSSNSIVNIEAENTGIAIIKFKKGTLGLVEATTAVRPNDLEGSLSILGESGSVVIDGFSVNKIKTWEFCKPIKEDEFVRSKHFDNPPDVYGFGHKRYYQHVIDCITNNTHILVDGVEGRKSIELINAIYESIESNSEIKYPFIPKLSKLGKFN